MYKYADVRMKNNIEDEKQCAEVQICRCANEKYLIEQWT